MSQAVPTVLVVIVLGMLSGLTPFALDMYLPAIPVIARSIGSTVEQMQLTISVFLLAFSLGQLFYGPLSDSFGRRKIIIIGLLCYMVASVAIVFSHSFQALSIWRVLQAFSGGAVSVAAMATLRDLYSGNELAKITSYLIMVISIAPMIAPSIGAHLLVFFSWRSIFVALAILGATGMALYLLLLKESLSVQNERPFNIGSILSGYSNILKTRESLVYLLVAGFSAVPVFIFITASPFVYIEYLGVSARQFGLLFGMNVVVMAFCAWLNTRLLKHFSYRTILQFAVYLGFAVSSAFLIVGLTVPKAHLLPLLAPLAAICVGINPLLSTNAYAGLMSKHAANAGSAASLFGCTRFGMGGISGIILSVFVSGSHLPMVVAMFISAVLSMAAFYWLQRL